MYFKYFFGHEFLMAKANGYYKDLSFMNRNLSRVVVIDFDEKAYLHNNNNVIKIPKYEGEQNDESLNDLLIFLKHLASPKIKDVRNEILKFGGFDESVEQYKNHINQKYKNIKKVHNFMTKKTHFNQYNKDVLI